MKRPDSEPCRPARTSGAVPTLAWMLKAPVAGRVKTRLAADIGREAARAAYCQLVDFLRGQIPRNWRVVVCFDPPDAEQTMRNWLGSDYEFLPQVCGDLGDRLKGVLAWHDFDRGPLVLIGGDCPYLDAERWVEVGQALGKAEIDGVLVPAVDGGYVLIGMKRRYDRLFEGISWSTGKVCEETLERARAMGLQIALLTELEDVDDQPSWSRAKTWLDAKKS